MTIDFAEKERQFLASLKATSGRDIAEWMAAIDAEAPPERNDIIDWLRQQGFPFARASWLERIHDNGGRPLYEGARNAEARRPPRTARAPRQAPAAPLKTAEIVPLARPALRLISSAEAPKPPPPPLAAGTALDGLLAKAKAYRPLAQHLLREIEKAVPGASPAPRDPLISIGAPAEFAVLLTGPRELRFGLVLGDLPLGDRFQKAKFGAGVTAASTITHMMALTDARQIDAELMGLARQAAARVNG